MTQPSLDQLAEQAARNVTPGDIDSPAGRSIVKQYAGIIRAAMVKWADAATQALREQLAQVTTERDHERHEKETVADASQAHARWVREKLHTAGFEGVVDCIARCQAAEAALTAQRDELATLRGLVAQLVRDGVVVPDAALSALLACTPTKSAG